MLKIALGQINPTVGDFVGNVDRMVRFAREAASAGAGLVVSSYCSQSELVLTFGLGRDKKVEGVEVEWPSGQRQSFTNLDANQFLLVEEGKLGPARIGW